MQEKTRAKLERSHAATTTCTGTEGGAKGGGGGGGGGGWSWARQRGQSGCAESHRSAQRRWKACRHSGSTRAACPASMSSRHTAHSWPATAPPSASPPSRSSSAVDSPFPLLFPSPFRSIDDHSMHMYTMNTTPIPKHTKNRATNRNSSNIIPSPFLSLSSLSSSLLYPLRTP
ncbi:unnamed protein product [Musa banksii]